MWLIQSWPPLLNMTPKDSVRFIARSNSWFQQVFYRLVSENREEMYFQNAVFKFLYFQTLSIGQSKIESGFNVLRQTLQNCCNIWHMFISLYFINLNLFQILCKTCQCWRYWLASGRMLTVLNISLHKTSLTSNIIIMIVFWQ